MSKILLTAAAVLALAGCVPADRAAGSVEVASEVQAKADLYGTSVKLEQALLDCEQAHPIPADHAPDHPASVPLAECVAAVYGVTR